jgi:hypothetical protein
MVLLLFSLGYILGGISATVLFAVLAVGKRGEQHYD